MISKIWVGAAVGALLAVAVSVPSALAQDQLKEIRHVLLISVDGLHALDVAKYVESHPNSALAELAGHG